MLFRSAQVFDQILPLFQRLTFLGTSASQVSTNLFRLLPPSLRHIEISSYHSNSSFRSDPSIFCALFDPSLELRITRFDLRDEGWEREDVELIRRALRERGVTFSYVSE